MSILFDNLLPAPHWLHDDTEPMPDLDELEFPAHIDPALATDPRWVAGYRAGWGVGYSAALAAVDGLEGGAR